VIGRVGATETTGRAVGAAGRNPGVEGSFTPHFPLDWPSDLVVERGRVEKEFSSFFYFPRNHLINKG